MAKGEAENMFQTDLAPYIEKFMKEAVLVWQSEHSCATIRNTKFKVQKKNNNDSLYKMFKTFLIAGQDSRTSL
jgi:predicted choloylglycine hydrolase